MGLVFQNPEVQLFNPTVFDEVAFAPLQLRWPKEQIVERVSAVLDLMQIGHLRGRPPHRLSGGEKKRVALASVLVLDPEVLLLDEPTAGLDPRSESQIIDMLIAWGDGARTVITTTHDLGLVEDIADHCVVLHEGKGRGGGGAGGVTARSGAAEPHQYDSRASPPACIGSDSFAPAHTSASPRLGGQQAVIAEQRIPGSDDPGLEDAFFDEGVGGH